MKKSVLIFCLLFHQNISFSQGCSSAGFCTMGVLKADQKFSNVKKIKLNYVEISQLIAFSGLGETINATTLDASLSFGRKNKLQVRLPYAWVNGPLANTRAFGDVYLAYSRNLLSKNNYAISAMIGTKLPRFTTALATYEGLPLPLYYSPSLGTYDLVLGVSFINQNWLLGIGYQQPLFNTTIDNQFNPKAWENTPLASQALRYDASTNLKRGGDIMMRIERNFRFGRYNAFVGSMPVYHITTDEISNDEGIRTRVENSKGISVTAIIGGGYNLTAHSLIKFFYGYTAIRRQANPDGLMKTSVATLTYEYKF
jgi:hypothetical protein